MKLKSFKELLIWQRSFALANLIFKCSISFPPEHRFGLTAQFLKSVVSVPSNIAEGYNRGSRKEYLYFLRVAYASLAELETQFLIAQAQGFFNDNDAEFIDNEIDEIGKMMNAIIVKLGAG